ncbi:MAG: sulfur globule protein precursor [Hyphomicrobiales bacterium]|nr:sulfur globule protein precursor [Hyphomicrobiales bacterium]
MISLRKSLFAVAALATLVIAGAVAPAAAQGRWGGWDGPRWDGGWRGEGRGWRDEDRGWRHRPHWDRPRCWIETRRIRVHTPWGPRLRTVEERVCR